MREWLASQGWNDVFLDIDPERGLVAADRWQKALNAAIGRCRAVIFLLSRNWLDSKHCISELDLAAHVAPSVSPSSSTRTFPSRLSLPGSGASVRLSI